MATTSTGITGIQRLDALSSSEMTPEEFAAHSLVVPVVRLASARATGLRLEVAAGREDRLDALRTEAERVLSRIVQDGKTLSQLVDRAITECLSIDLRDDLWTSRFPAGKNIVLVQGELFDRISERDIVEFVHRCEVEASVVRGSNVPAEVVAYYRNKPRAVLARTHMH